MSERAEIVREDGPAAVSRPGRPCVLKDFMNAIDLTEDPRIPAYMYLAEKLGTARDPRDLVEALQFAMWQAHGARGRCVVSTRDLPAGQYRVSPIVTASEMIEGPAPQGSMMQLSEVMESTLFLGHDEDALPVCSGGFIGELIGTTEPKLLHHVDIPEDAVLGTALAGYRSVMVVPLYFTGAPHYWNIILDEAPEGIRLDEVSDTILRGNLVGAAMSNLARTQRLRSAKKWIDREMDQIAELQREFLPQELPRIKGLRIAAHYESFERAGGDYFDFIPLRDVPGTDDHDPEGPWAFVVADAAGHGPSAAVLTAMLHTVLNGIAGVERGPAQILEYVNRRMTGRRMKHNLVTAFCGVYDPVSRVLRYARAGHNPPLLATPGPDGLHVRALDDVNGFPIGVAPRVASKEGEVKLEEGQTLVLYTDGITDAAGPDNSRFDIGGLKSALRDCSGAPDCVVGSIVAALRAFEGGEKPQDDQTLVAIQAVDA